MHDPWSRRQFLGATLAGAATVSMPSFLAACAKESPVNALAAVPVDPFLDWYGVDQATVAQVMTELTGRGATFADLYFQYSRYNGIQLEDGIVSAASSTVDQGVGLRCVVGDQVGYAFTEDLSLESMKGAARTAAAIAQGNTALVPQAFTAKATPDRYQISVPWAQVGIDRKLPILQKAEALAKAADPSVKKVSVSWQDVEERVIVATSEGQLVKDVRPMTRLWVTVTAQKGDQTQSGSANVAGRHGIEWYTDERLKLVVQQAMERTLVLFEAGRPPAGEMPVVLAAGASGILLHEAIGHGMEADFNRKGASIYANLMGKDVAEKFVNIVDDGTLDNERGTLNVDDEGNPTEKTYLVKDGVLASYLHDKISAKHYGVAPTGSGRRESFRHPVMPRMRATYMEAGPHSKEEIIASVKKGIVAETFLNGEVQIGAGDYTFYIRNGWLIEDGKITRPIKDVNIIGNGPESLRRVTMVGNDPKLDTGGWTCGKDGQSVPVSQGMPTVLVSTMTVGGVHG